MSRSLKDIKAKPGHKNRSIPGDTANRPGKLQSIILERNRFFRVLDNNLPNALRGQLPTASDLRIGMRLVLHTASQCRLIASKKK